MTKTTTKSKGHRFEKVTYHVPFYSAAFFERDNEKDDGDEKSKSGKTVKIPMKINAAGDDSRGNVTTWELKGISHFDNNVEEVLDTLSQLQERIIQPRAIEDRSESIKTTLQLMQLVCNAGPATQTLQEACRTARQTIFDTYIEQVEEDNDDVQEDILVNEETAFFEYLDGNHGEFEADEFDDEDAYRDHLYEEFFRAFWNYLHSIIFGADAYRAFKQQKDYLLNKLIKPFGVTVESAFRRIEVVTNLMTYFPPPSSRGKAATKEQWEAFEDIKKMPSSLKKEMKYNLLPEAFHDRFDTLEIDWSEMNNSKFLAEAQKCETIDGKDRQKLEKAKEALKRKKQQESDSVSTLNRSQKSKNNTAKKFKNNNEKATSAGKARLCELCKMAGAPEFVYISHNTNNCSKKEDYARKLSGSLGQRQTAKREIRKAEKDLRRELKTLSRQVRKLKGTKRSKRSKDNDISSFSSANSDSSSA